MFYDLLHFGLFILLSFVFSCILEYARLNINQVSLPKQEQRPINIIELITSNKGFEVNIVGTLMALSFAPDLNVILYWSMQLVMIYFVKLFIDTPFVKRKNLAWTIASIVIVFIMVTVNIYYYK